MTKPLELQSLQVSIASGCPSLLEVDENLQISQKDSSSSLVLSLLGNLRKTLGSSKSGP